MGQDMAEHEKLGLSSFEDRIAEFKKKRSLRSISSISDQRTALRNAASVLVNFDPEVLNPFPTLEVGKRDREDFYSDLILLNSRKNLWKLKDSIRIKHLEELSSGQKLSNARNQNIVSKPTNSQKYIDNYLSLIHI